MGFAEIVGTFVLRVPAVERARNGVAGGFVPDAAIGDCPGGGGAVGRDSLPGRGTAIAATASAPAVVAKGVEPVVELGMAESHERDRRCIGPNQLEAKLEDPIFERLAIEPVR